MAKALLGHIGSAPDVRLVGEVRRLRERVQDLEHEVAVLRAANARLSEHRLADDEILSLNEAFSDDREPAYT